MAVAVHIDNVGKQSKQQRRLQNAVVPTADGAACSHSHLFLYSQVSKKLSKVCQSVSEGLGEERYVAVVAKGAVRPAAR